MNVFSYEELSCHLTNSRNYRAFCGITFAGKAAKSPIHHHTDSSLLNDCRRALARIMDAAREDFELTFADHRRQTKKHSLEILGAEKKRLKPYKDMLLELRVDL